MENKNTEYTCPLSNNTMNKVVFKDKQYLSAKLNSNIDPLPNRTLPSPSKMIRYCIFDITEPTIPTAEGESILLLFDNE